MANEEVLRLRATIVSEEALANIRKIGREIGLVPRNAGRGVAQVNTQFAALGKTIQGVGQGIQQAIPALGGFSLGAAGIGLAAGLLVRSLGDTAKKFVELKYASKELGMSEEALRAWGSAAEKAGIAPEAMNASLKSFKRNTEDFALRIGNVREELVKFGAGPVLAAMNAATDQSDKLKVAFDFKEVLDKADPSGVKARRFFEMIGLGADTARLSYKEFMDEKAKQPIISDADKAAAKAYADGLVDLGTKWDILKNKVGVKLFPFLNDELDKASKDFDTFVKDCEQFYERLKKMREGGEEGKKAAADAFGTQPFGPSMDWMNQTPAELAPKLTQQPFGSSMDWMNMTPGEAWNKLFGGGGAPAAGPGRAVGGPVSRGIRYTVGENGPEQFTPSTSGMIHPASSGGDDAQASRIIKVGVFDALVDFKSYIEAGAVSGGGGGGGGFMRASFGGSGGAAAGGGVGGFGGGAPSGSQAPSGDNNNAPGTGGQQASRPGPGGNSGHSPDDGHDHGPQAPVAGTGAGAGVPGGNAGGTSAGITAPAGTPIAKQNLATVTSSSGRKFQVDQRFKANFQGFINDYEKAGGVIGPESGTLGHRPHNASGHPVGAAIDVNQVGYGIRGKKGKTIDPKVEDQLAEKWGMVSGNKWKRHDQGHFGIRDAATARQALINNGVPPDEATAIANSKAPPNGQATQPPAGTQAPNGAPAGAQVQPNGQGAQTPYAQARAAAVAAGIKDPDTAAAIAMYESGNMRRGKGGIFDRSGGTNPFGQTGVGSKGYIVGADGQKHKVYGSLSEGFQDHARRWGGRYGDTPEETTKNLVGGGYNTVNPAWSRNVLAIRKREMAKLENQNRVAAATPTSRIDQQVAPAAASGQVNVQVNSNGTKATAEAKTDGDLFQKPQVKQHRQMQKTEDAGETLSI